MLNRLGLAGGGAPAEVCLVEAPVERGAWDNRYAMAIIASIGVLARFGPSPAPCMQPRLPTTPLRLFGSLMTLESFPLPSVISLFHKPPPIDVERWGATCQLQWHTSPPRQVFRVPGQDH